jgi:hypothetical protein
MLLLVTKNKHNVDNVLVLLLRESKRVPYHNWYKDCRLLIVRSRRGCNDANKGQQVYLLLRLHQLL